MQHDNHVILRYKIKTKTYKDLRYNAWLFKRFEKVVNRVGDHEDQRELQQDKCEGGFVGGVSIDKYAERMFFMYASAYIHFLGYSLEWRYETIIILGWCCHI
ncbi:hypothetical protein HanXRQr2_Chr17g0830941 [Helianthus annuus]|uniref:Uncharacterized protein n=1 Tax=Helianthus annuus TaxID=4232 RepID=A0A9K3GVV9_HELAN|nr:hypothetical protein HanXRQr2_Chr17g0830941 [Helianthus annuus]